MFRNGRAATVEPGGYYSGMITRSTVTSPLIALLFVAACGGGQDSAGAAQEIVTPGTEQVVTLTVGEQRDLPGGITLGLTAVPSDSRCPRNVTCVWAGSAAVTLSLKSGSSDTTATINTGVDPRQFTWRGWHVRLRDVTPSPDAGASTPRDAYRVTVGVGRD